ncbi:helix-turn-helix transcriptional regulator [Pseudaquabacterium pictum]|uniref:HTH luxR-type domain-containing protein n=1 Tax=Pseudaquabacterium pictum TaxID=2315236 RepID=A0A480AL55_9BURK|nr:LuxR C-terminal-related transcriptional regulator [Rubrivivax pictus]GCL62123.1 hypothetical protein AQPW35_12040 [Rubrivivax pictus]
MAWIDTQTLPTWQPMQPASHTDLSVLMHVLDQIDYGIALGGAGLGWQCNRTARLQLAEPDAPLGLRANEIVAQDAAQTSILRSAVHVAQTQRHRRLLTFANGARRVSVAVVPVGQDGEAGNPSVMLLLGRRAVCARLTTQQFCTLHGLTPAESDVLAAVLAGRAPREIAVAHGVSVTTVRSQVSAIKAKTGAKRLQEVLLQVALLPPLVPLFETIR